EWKTFYMISVTLIFAVAMVLQIPRLQVPYLVKMCVFIGWAAYGVLPTLHWTYVMGGFDNPMVQIFFPRVIGMYVISGTAFAIYAFKTETVFSSAYAMHYKDMLSADFHLRPSLSLQHVK
ncbi:jg23486, partial [Pararge aegeria aegeria]